MTEISEKAVEAGTRALCPDENSSCRLCGEMARKVLTAALSLHDGARDDWKLGAESMREAILQQLPGGQSCDPQSVADMIRAIEVPQVIIAEDHPVKSE